MKIIFSIFIITLSVFLSASNLQTRDLSAKKMKEQNREIAKLAAAELARSLPQSIDKYTKLVGVEAHDTTLVYIFEIDTAPKSDASVRKEDRTRMQKAVTQGVCRSSQRFLQADISISYLYKSARSKADLFRFDINSEHCRNLKN